MLSSNVFSDPILRFSVKLCTTICKYFDFLIFVRLGTIAMVILVENKKIDWTILVHEPFLTVVT